MSRAFRAGIVAALSAHMAIQDWYGLEGYIQHLQTWWVDVPWWVSAVACLVAIWWAER